MLNKASERLFACLLILNLTLISQIFFITTHVDDLAGVDHFFFRKFFVFSSLWFLMFSFLFSCKVKKRGNHNFCSFFLLKMITFAHIFRKKKLLLILLSFFGSPPLHGITIFHVIFLSMLVVSCSINFVHGCDDFGSN